MQFKYHRFMLEQVLADCFSPAALRVIIRANLWQDNLIGNLLYPERHFTENKLAEALAYIEEQHTLALSALQNSNDSTPAWQAFGRLLHTAQDFYAHSNYVRLWIERFEAELPPPDQIEALDEALLGSSGLYTTRAYRPQGIFGHLPFIGHWFFPLLPADAHARMNLDTPAKGALFPYAMAAAQKRTEYEYQKITARINNCGGQEMLGRFRDS